MVVVTGQEALKRSFKCLVQGTRATTIVVRLPPGAKTPPTLPAIQQSVNTALKKMGHDLRIKEIHYGIRCHLNLVLNQVYDSLQRGEVLDLVLPHFKTSYPDITDISRDTYSIIKFTAVPNVTSNGTLISSEHATQELHRGAWAQQM